MELADLVAGRRRLEDADWERTAWAVAHLMNVSGKQVRGRVTAKKLLGRGPKTRQELEAQFGQLWERMQQQKPNGS